MAEKEFDSIIDAFLAERAPDWKDVGLKDAQKSGEDILDRTHQHVDDSFLGELTDADLKSKKSATLTSRIYEKEHASPQVTAVRENWHTAASEDSKAENDDASLMNEVTMSLEQAGKEGKVEKKEVSESAIQSYIKKLLNMGVTPAKVAAKLEKLAEVELFNHQMATDYLQRNAGMLGLAYLEPNSFMDKQNPNYHHNASADSKDCVRTLEEMKKAGGVRAKSVKQSRACAGCTYFKSGCNGKRCNLFHLPIVANTKELSQIVNQLTPGVPNKMKHAALVQIANRTDERVQPFDAAKTAQTNLIKTADAHMDHQAARVQQTKQAFTSAHVAKLHEKGVTLSNIYKWADKKFGSVDTSVAFRGFVQSLRKNDKGRVVVAAADLKFLNAIGIRNEAFEGAAKCASCETHLAESRRVNILQPGQKWIDQSGAVYTINYVDGPSKMVALKNPMGEDVMTSFKSLGNELMPYHQASMRVDQKFASRTLDVVRGQQAEPKVAGNNFNVKVAAKVVEKLVVKGETIASIYRRAAEKLGSVRAKAAIQQFINDMKNTTTKIALSQLDCQFLKNKLGMSNAIVGSVKCADCAYRKGMHCGFTGGTLLGYPGMNDSKKTASSEAVQDGHALLNEYELSSAAPQQDIDVNGPDHLEPP